MEVKAGKLLLAQPFMLDPNFKRSVVLLCEHDTTRGSLGFILNKPLHMKVQDLISNFPEIDSTVYFGGPVATDTIHYIHDKGDLLEDSVEVYRGIYWGGDFERLKFLIEAKLIKESNIQFFVGYSGWSEEQLADELKTGSWIAAEMDSNYLFHKDENVLWKKVLENKGSSFGVIGQIPESHRLN
ncbi:YqgE/AlgH family protein [Portibacter lacus]|uniref:UPF0301 protein n=1 Tax=Portibacter lacus TaxID=1099794 RepID=A0AA37SRE4_9BACT|nr:YqgE/AlgH family protein [Portibacter lacus]GLR18334.1 UPF0301 protein [Portibacter lacus]